MHGPGGGWRRLAEMPEDKARDRSRVFMRLLRMALPYKLVIILALILTAVNAATQGASPYLIGLAIDRFISNSDKSGLAWIMLALAVVYLVGMISGRLQGFLIGKAAQQLLADLRNRVFDKIESLSLQYLESKQAGDLMSRLVNDIDTINSFFSQALVQMVGAVFALVGIVIAMLALNWEMALAVLVMLPVLLLATNAFSKLARNAFRKTRTTIGDVSADLEEELGGVKVAQAFNRTDTNVRRFTERNAANRDANVNATAVTSAFSPTMDVLSTLDMALVAAMGGAMVIAGNLSVGVVVAFLQYVQNFFRPLQMVAQMWTMSQSAFAGAERVFELLDMVPAILDDPQALDAGTIAGRVEFDQVSFSYETDVVLNKVSFRVESGKTVAIVGPTGAGKTTLVSLIPRLYDVDSGHVRIDGVDVRHLSQKSLRSQMGIVTQEPFLFSGSIMDNIRYGRLEASDDEVMEAAKAAYAHDFISRLPDGYQTAVGERGKLLSQGQRQLVSIARAILSDPRIVILDEATASIDTQTEVLIQKALHKLLQDRTSFVIAHRLSTVRNADIVLVIDQGEIVEHGTHSELIGLGGLYADLYKRQFYQPVESLKMA